MAKSRQINRRWVAFCLNTSRITLTLSTLTFLSIITNARKHWAACYDSKSRRKYIAKRYRWERFSFSAFATERVRAIWSSGDSCKKENMLKPYCSHSSLVIKFPAIIVEVNGTNLSQLFCRPYKDFNAYVFCGYTLSGVSKSWIFAEKYSG